VGGGLQVDAVLADGPVKGHWFLATGAYKTAGFWFGTGAAVKAGIVRALVDGALTPGPGVATGTLAEVAGDVGLDAGGAVQAGRGVADVDGDLTVHALVAG